MGFSSLRTPPLSLRRHHFNNSLSTRLKREEHPLPPNLDNLFSEWKVLVGPTDWQQYFSGAEGSERYRLNNVKGVPFCPGVYELALCPNECSRTYRTRSNRKLKSTIVVYVGQAENIYSRLQDYGRTGSHLESSGDGKCAKSSKSSQYCNSAHEILFSDGAVCDCPCLFTKAFSQGYRIAFRWTQARSVVDAKAIEAGLLKLFDYAWNRETNGERRPNDTFKKLHEIEQLRIKSIFKAINNFFTRNDRLAVHQSTQVYRQLYELPWSFQENKERVLTKSECRNSGIQKKGASIQKPDICGVQNANGIHKGILRTATVKQEKEYIIFTPCDSTAGLREPRPNVTVCGVIDTTGMICTKIPIHGRKRCDIHKGMRIHCYAATLSQVCGIINANGIACKEKPLPGRRRCTAHKSMRLHSSSLKGFL